MNMLLVSLICTVLNEEKTIKDYLNSILNQTFLPDEIIIVDGGSKDKTFQILKKYEDTHPNLIKVLQLKGANIAQGRNYAIKNARGIIIVTTDAGCVYDKDYVKEITKPLLKFLLDNKERFNIKKEDILEYIKNKNLDFNDIQKEESAEFVQGRYYPYQENNFEYFAGFMLVKQKQCKVPSRTSARATAYFKYVWEKVGGYPEVYVTGEETKFNYNVLDQKFKWACKDTKVFWKMPSNIKQFYKKFEKYAIGDVIQGNIFRNKKLLILFFGSFLYLFLLIYSAIFNRTYLLHYYWY